MKKIAIIYRNLAGLSGVPNIVSVQAKALVELGYAVDLIAERLDKSRFDQNKMGFVKIPRLPFIKKNRVQRFSDKANKLTERGYDFVAGHGHNTEQDALSMHNCAHLFYERILDKPKVVGPDAIIQDQIFAADAFKVCIVNSRLMRDEFLQRYSMDEGKLDIIYPGYDSERFNTKNKDECRKLVRQEWGISDSIFLAGLVTSGAFQLRGVDIAIDAYARLPGSIRQGAGLVIVGNDSRLETYQQQVSSLGLENRIWFRRAKRNIERYYHALDVLVHPARLETFGLVVQEAMASGLPVISNQQVGATELLPPSIYSELAKTPQIEDVSERLEKIISDKDYRSQWTEVSKQAVAGNSIELNFNKTLEVYRKAGL